MLFRSGERELDSNGIYLGGTGAANYLDDYEEGTWTPTLPNGGTLTVVAARYIKVGQQVHATLYINSVSPTNNSDQFQIGGLPFASGYANVYSGGSFAYVGDGTLSTWAPLIGGGGSVIYFHELNGSSADKTNANYLSARGSNPNIVMSVTYISV